MDCGILTLIAPDHLSDEVISKIPEKAVEWNVPEEDILHIWEEYKVKIHFVPHPPVNADTEHECIDPKDLPYVILQRQFPENLIVTSDEHIQSMGGSTIKPTVFIDLRDYARHKAVEVKLVFGGSVVATVGLGSIAFIGKKILKIWMNLPTWAKLATIFILSLLLIHPRSRKAIVSGINYISEKTHDFLDATAPIIQHFLDEHAAAKRIANEKLDSFQAQIPPHARRPRLKSIVHSVLANDEAPLTISEIESGVLLAGYKPRGNFSRPYLLRVLKKHPGITQFNDGKWGFGAASPGHRRGLKPTHRKC